MEAAAARLADVQSIYRRPGSSNLLEIRRQWLVGRRYVLSVPLQRAAEELPGQFLFGLIEAAKRGLF